MVQFIKRDFSVSPPEKVGKLLYPGAPGWLNWLASNS